MRSAHLYLIKLFFIIFTFSTAYSTQSSTKQIQRILFGAPESINQLPAKYTGPNGLREKISSGDFLFTTLSKLKDVTEVITKKQVTEISSPTKLGFTQIKLNAPGNNTVRNSSFAQVAPLTQIGSGDFTTPEKYEIIIYFSKLDENGELIEQDIDLIGPGEINREIYTLRPRYKKLVPKKFKISKAIQKVRSRRERAKRIIQKIISAQSLSHHAGLQKNIFIWDPAKFHNLKSLIFYNQAEEIKIEYKTGDGNTHEIKINKLNSAKIGDIAEIINVF